MNPGFCEKMELTHVPPGRPSRTTTGTRTTGWEPLFYTHSRYCSLQCVTVIHRVVHGTYLSVPFPSHSNLCLSHPMGRFPWNSHRNDIPIDKPRGVHGTYLSVPFPSHRNLCLSHPMGRFLWDTHRNDIPMDKPGKTHKSISAPSLETGAKHSTQR